MTARPRAHWLILGLRRREFALLTSGQSPSATAALVLGEASRRRGMAEVLSGIVAISPGGDPHALMNRATKPIPPPGTRVAR